MPWLCRLLAIEQVAIARLALHHVLTGQWWQLRSKHRWLCFALRQRHLHRWLCALLWPGGRPGVRVKRHDAFINDAMSNRPAFRHTVRAGAPRVQTLAQEAATQIPVDAFELEVSDSGTSAAQRQGRGQRRSILVTPGDHKGDFYLQNRANGHELSLDGRYSKRADELYISLFQKNARGLPPGSGARQHRRAIDALFADKRIRGKTKVRLDAVPIDWSGAHSNQLSDLMDRTYTPLGYVPSPGQDIAKKRRHNATAFMEATVNRLRNHDPKKGRHGPVRVTAFSDAVPAVPPPPSTVSTPATGSIVPGARVRSAIPNPNRRKRPYIYNDSIDPDDDSTWGNAPMAQPKPKPKPKPQSDDAERAERWRRALAEQSTRVGSHKPKPESDPPWRRKRK